MWISFVVILFFLLEAAFLIWLVKRFVPTNSQMAATASADKKTTSLVFLVVGGLCLLASFGFSIYTLQFLKRSVRTTGKIIEMRGKTDSEDKSTTMAPVFVFTDMNGAFHTNESSLSSNPPEHEVGDTVPVLYIPERPDRARIDQFVYHWFGAIVTGVLGAAFLSLAWGTHYFKKRSSKSVPIPIGQ